MSEAPKEKTIAPASKEPFKDEIYTHIASQSATKLGLCLTLLGLLRVVEGLKKIDTLADEILALGALAFLVAGTFAYFALRTEKPRSKYLAGKIADTLFLISHGVLILTCLIIAFQFI